MLAHLEAVRAALEPLGYGSHLISVTDPIPAPPYWLIWSSVGRTVAPTVDDAHTDIEDFVRLTAVAATPEFVYGMHAQARDILTPGGLPGRLEVAGRSAWLRPAGFEPPSVEVDFPVVIPGTSLHPHYAVDIYRLTSTPI